MGKVESILLEIVQDEDELKRFLEQKTIDDVYNFILKKDETIGKEEFDETITEMFDNHFGKGSKEIKEEDLGLISGGTGNFGRKATSAVMSLLTVFPGFIPSASALEEGDMSGSTQSRYRWVQNIQDSARGVKNYVVDLSKRGYERLDSWLSKHPIYARLIGSAAAVAVVCAVAVVVKNKVCANPSLSAEQEPESAQPDLALDGAPAPAPAPVVDGASVAPAPAPSPAADGASHSLVDELKERISEGKSPASEDKKPSLVGYGKNLEGKYKRVEHVDESGNITVVDVPLNFYEFSTMYKKLSNPGVPHDKNDEITLLVFEGLEDKCARFAIESCKRERKNKPLKDVLADGLSRRIAPHVHYSDDEGDSSDDEWDPDNDVSTTSRALKVTSGVPAAGGASKVTGGASAAPAADKTSTTGITSTAASGAPAAGETPTAVDYSSEIISRDREESRSTVSSLVGSRGGSHSDGEGKDRKDKRGRKGNKGKKHRGRVRFGKPEERGESKGGHGEDSERSVTTESLRRSARMFDELIPTKTESDRSGKAKGGHGKDSERSTPTTIKDLGRSTRMFDKPIPTETESDGGVADDEGDKLAKRERKAKEKAEKAERERKAKEEAEKAEKERKAKEEAEKAEKERKAKEEKKAKKAAKRKRKAEEEAERERKAEEEERAKKEAEEKRRAEEEAEKAREAEEKRRTREERKAKKAAERRAKEEAKAAETEIEMNPDQSVIKIPGGGLISMSNDGGRSLTSTVVSPTGTHVSSADGTTGKLGVPEVPVRPDLPVESGSDKSKSGDKTREKKHHKKDRGKGHGECK